MRKSFQDYQHQHFYDSHDNSRISYGYDQSSIDAVYPMSVAYPEGGSVVTEGTWMLDSSPTSNTPYGYYFPLPKLTCAIYSAPVSAIAYDLEAAAMYVSSHTQPFGERPRRASMLVTHNTLNGSLYSSCAGHPEADSALLNSMYSCFFSGTNTNTIGKRNIGRVTSLPSHVYQPPYGRITQQPQASHVGITALLSNSPGFVTSISPAGVRIHTMGGHCITDNHMEGMFCGTFHPESQSTHISVAGINSAIHLLDFYQELRIVSSYTIADDLGVMALNRNDAKRVLITGCSDGTLRLIDGRMIGAEVGKLKSHIGGVTSVAISMDGVLIATTGLSAKSGGNSFDGLYAYPDPNVLLYDIRYLGRGGIVHPFSGAKCGPRFLAFLPNMPDMPNNRLVVASGQPNGGIGIMTPFDSEIQNNALNFIFPDLNQGESITCLTLNEQNVALGTSNGNVLQYELAGYKETVTTKLDTKDISKNRKLEKIPLDMPNFFPEVPIVSLEPTLLQSTNKAFCSKTGFESYILCREPTVSRIGDREASTFGCLAKNPRIPTPRQRVLDSILQAASKSDADRALIIATSELKLSDAKAENFQLKQRLRKKNSLENYNKFVFCNKYSSICYLSDSRLRGKGKSSSRVIPKPLEKKTSSEIGKTLIPSMYALTLRPPNVSYAHFDHSKYNSTGVWPGWDYAPEMPGSHIPPVLLLLYFDPLVRADMLQRQYDKRLFSSKTVDQVPTLSTELGFLFHHIQSLSQHAMCYSGNGVLPHVDVFRPINFLNSFMAMPEAKNLALLDDHPIAPVRARRPEAFYRFLLHHLDKEAGSKKNKAKPLDYTHGADFESINTFISGKGKPYKSSTRSMTLDLYYDNYVSMKDASEIRFGDILYHSLCRETRLRAWNSETKAYETVLQRKMVSTFPKVLSITCGCSGGSSEHGLSLWQKTKSYWLPEVIEIEMNEESNLVVREQIGTEFDQIKWHVVGADSSIQARNLDDTANPPTKSKVLYRLDSVLSFIPDGSNLGHHIVHVRVPTTFKERALEKQVKNAEQLLKHLQANASKIDQHLTLTAKVPVPIVSNRIQRVKESMRSKQPQLSEWILFNGHVVTQASAEDVRSFNMGYKEPCLVIYRNIQENIDSNPETMNFEKKIKDLGNVMQSKSISTGKPSIYAVKDLNNLPGEGDLISLDAEFVSVQEEDVEMSESGDKMVIRETRLVLARVSVIDCRTERVIIDDYVLPKEPVVDYLTRFSGIHPEDLDPKTSPHHLITARTAYLKLRYLVERGCIFVGHGLSTDFSTVNLFVPPCQIIDTVEIYRIEQRRHISLRFLANYVLKRDMQQDTHDSVEDAKTAFDLYKHAIALNAKNDFEKFLRDLYQYGDRTEWRLGVSPLL